MTIDEAAPPRAPEGLIQLPVRRTRADVRQQLAALLRGPGPFLSMYLDLSPGTARATAPDRLRRRLAALPQVTDHQRAVAVAAVADAHDDHAMAVVLADGAAWGSGAVSAGYPDPPRHDVVDQAELPYLAPLLSAEQALSHHVVAILEDDHLDLLTMPRHGEPVSAGHEVTDPLAAASLVLQACRASDTSLAILCAPAVNLASLTSHLQSELPVSTRLATIPSDSMDPAELADGVVRQVANNAAERTVELLRLWRFHHAHQEAVDGEAATMAAIREGRASLVLVHDDPRDQRRAWFGPEPEMLAGPSEIIPGATGSAHDLRLGRLTDVVLRAALLTGCPVHVVPDVSVTLRDGLGAIVSDQADPEALAELLER